MKTVKCIKKPNKFLFLTEGRDYEIYNEKPYAYEVMNDLNSLVWMFKDNFASPVEVPEPERSDEGNVHIPTLEGKDAERFIRNAEESYRNKGSIDFTEQIKSHQKIMANCEKREWQKKIEEIEQEKLKWIGARAKPEDVFTVILAIIKS